MNHSLLQKFLKELVLYCSFLIMNIYKIFHGSFRFRSILPNTIIGGLEIDQYPAILTPQNWNCNKIRYPSTIIWFLFICPSHHVYSQTLNSFQKLTMAARFDCVKKNQQKCANAFESSLLCCYTWNHWVLFKCLLVSRHNPCHRA